MKISSQKPETWHPATDLVANEETLRKCDIALELKDQGDHEGAQKAMRPLWRMGERPETKGLHPAVAAEVLLCAGILTGWLGSKSENKNAQEAAKNLITESITNYESLGNLGKIAAARAEIAFCYCREGELNEARIMLHEALQGLTAEGNTRARALLKLTTVEMSASRFHVALEILDENASLFEKVTNHTIKGAYHTELAIVLRNLAKSDPSKTEERHQQALSEYEQADHHFRLAKNNVFRARVKNNVGLLLFELGRFKEAHKYLAEAQRFALGVRDKVAAAQFDETRAQVLIAETNLVEAEAVVRRAIGVLEKSGQQGLLADALITHGITLARLKQDERAQFTFQKAIEVANQVGADNKAGLAALTMIEELDDLSRTTLQSSFRRASEGLAESQRLELARRFNAAANKVFIALNGELTAEDVTESVFTPCNLPREVLKFEGTLIRRALIQANGSVTRAASLLSLSYQALAYIIGGRHKDLLDERSPVRHRRSQRQDNQNRQSQSELREKEQAGVTATANRFSLNRHRSDW